MGSSSGTRQGGGGAAPTAGPWQLPPPSLPLLVPPSRRLLREVPRPPLLAKEPLPPPSCEGYYAPSLPPPSRPARAGTPLAAQSRLSVKSEEKQNSTQIYYVWSFFLKEERK